MKRYLNIRNLFSLALLWLAASALVFTLKMSIRGLTDAAFLPIVIVAMVLAYLLGLSNSPARATWVFLISFSFPLILLAASRTAPALWQIFLHLPALQVNALFAWITGQSLDLSFLRMQLDIILQHMEIFLRSLPPGPTGPGPVLLEVLWDLPLFLIGAWSGWWTSRRNSILVALVPSLAVQVFLLNYADRPEGLTLQIGVFTLILLMALHQKWSLPKSESKTQDKVRIQTYATVFILASVLALSAGLAPIFPFPEKPAPIATPTKIANPGQDLTQTVATETIATPIVESNTSSTSGIPPQGLPRDLLIDSAPQLGMSVIFLANTGETPLLGTDEISLEPAAPGYYWRWITYDQYDGRVWSSSTTTSAVYSAGQPLFEFSGTGYRTVHQTITKASAEDDHLYWTGSLMRADQPMDTTWRTSPPGADPLLHMDMLGTLVQAQQYSADSLLPQFNETQLREASQVYPTEILQKYLSLPRNISQRVRDLAVTLTYQAQNPYDKAKAIEAHLRTYPYTLDVPAVPADREIADYFLFEIKTGYCEYYATAMMVMARTVGLPARLVIGYASNEYDPVTAQYIVREANSHAWVEIYFPDLGWVEFEPTASQPLPQRDQPLPLPTPESAEDLNAPILTEEPTPTPTNQHRIGIIYEKHGLFVPRKPIFAILFLSFATLGICLGTGVWVLRTEGLWFSFETIGSMYKYIYRHGRKIVPDAPPHATPSLFARKLKAKLKINHRFALPAAEELDQLTALYLKETYSPHLVTQIEHEQAVKTWQRLFWRLLYIRLILKLPAFIRLSRF